MDKIKKFAVLFALFIVPLLFYLLLSSGINNFAKLPIVTKQIVDVTEIDATNTVQFKHKISIVCFLGNNVDKEKSSFFNLAEKIYKPFYDFKDFQLVAIVPNGNEAEIEKFKKEVEAYTNMKKWNFVYASPLEITAFYESFNTNAPLVDLYSQKAFIVDKDGNLRGRTDDKDSVDGKLYGYNTQSVAELNDKMKDDVKVVLAEYRLALKKNNADREI